jgi:hypothetical protein
MVDFETKEFGMQRVIVLAGTFFLLCGVSGCGGESHDKLLGDIVTNIKETGDELSKIKTNEDAKAHAKRLADLGNQLKQLKQQASALKNPPDADEQKRLADKYKDDLRDAIARERKEWNRVKDIPDVVQTLEQAKALDAFREIQ